MRRFAMHVWALRDGGGRSPLPRVEATGDTMAMILNFRSRQDRFEPPESPQLQASQERAEPAGAQIIIFPGVRREHHVEAPKPKRQRARPKRDRLELPD